MSISTTILSSRILNPWKPIITVLYQCPGVAAGASSTDSLALELLGVGNASYRDMYRNIPQTGLAGESYSIQPVMIGIASNSTDLDVQFYTVDATSGLAINNPYTMSSINLSNFAYDLGSLILTNEETPMRNYVYLMLTNNDGGNATGDVYVHLSYLTLLDLHDL